ncbi:MAG: response regulator [Gammaproteobacteria bacterium]|nr:response regulator [Gammaproteobacteria bacterium]
MSPKSNNTPNILVVDDESQNLEIIQEYLADEVCCKPILYSDSLKAWQELETNPTTCDVILLDWMMPELDGLEMLYRIKQHPELRFTPVIMQTARTEKQDILKGLAAGAFYYLTKPYSYDELVQIIKAALDDVMRFRELEALLQNSDKSKTISTGAEFNIKNLNDADHLASVLANSCPEPDKVITGISELLINAIEHGNLQIGYKEKSQLKKQGSWREEIERRLQLPEYQDKVAEVTYSKNGKNINITITDQGSGFDWHKFLEFSPERAFDSHGRGIAMAKIMSFDEISYNEAGNQVTATIAL